MCKNKYFLLIYSIFPFKYLNFAVGAIYCSCVWKLLIFFKLNGGMLTVNMTAMALSSTCHQHSFES